MAKTETVLIDGKEHKADALLELKAADLAALHARLEAAEALLQLADRCHRQHPPAFFLTSGFEGRPLGEQFIDRLRAWVRQQQKDGAK